jgi:hypothetical protein
MKNYRADRGKSFAKGDNQGPGKHIRKAEKYVVPPVYAIPQDPFLAINFPIP